MEDNQPNPNKFIIQDVTATKRIFSLKKRIRAVAGGTSASKTVSILVWLIDYCQTPQRIPKVVDIVSETLPHLKMGAISDFETIMKDRGYWDDARWNKTDRVYTYETGNVMHFYSVDTYGKAHGPRRHILFVNEANYLPYNIVDQLITRTREIVWLDWNPTAEFWFYTDMLPRRDDIDFITLTYKDNEALDETTIKEIESHKHNKNWWLVYGLGQLGEVEARIFTGWTLDMDEIPPEARLERYGLDFGYSNDPSALIAIYKWNDSYILDELVYLKGMSNKNLADAISMHPKALVIGDSSEPKSIDEIKEYGINILPAVKGQGSVLQGIQNVQQQKIFVTKRSINIIKEYRNYLWLTDPEGKIINEPQDFMNHAMDAIRYGLDTFNRPVQFVQNQSGGVLPYDVGIRG
jgi:phage terminase large subunit